MYTPSFRVKKSGVPVLSKKEIDTIGERFVRDFQPEVLTDPAPVDIESFIECYLGMTADYQYLSHNGVYLGMTVFNDTNRVIVFDPNTQRAEYIHAKARTVIIDNRLLEEDQHQRYRFTLGHEGGHDILHSGFFSYNPDQLSMFEPSYAPMIQCRVDNTVSKRPNTGNWSDHDWMEWQANALASSILMPETAVRIVAEPYKSKLDKPLTRASLIVQISTVFDVSISAATIRLKDLGYIDKNDNNDLAYAGAILDFGFAVAQ